MFKKIMSKVVRDTHASSGEPMDMILSECLNAANGMTRHGGLALAQSVLSRLPRSVVTIGDENECLDVCGLQAHTDGQTTSAYSHATEQKHVKRLYNGIVVKESVVLLFEKPRLSLENSKCWIQIDTTMHMLGNFRSCARMRCHCSLTSMYVIRNFLLHASQKFLTFCSGRLDATIVFIDERTSLDMPTIADPSRTADDVQDDENVRAYTIHDCRQPKVGQERKRVTGSVAQNCVIRCKFITY